MCKKNLPIAEFRTNKRRKDGLQSQCTICQKEYRRKHYEANRPKYIKKAKNWTASFRKWWKDFKRTLKCEMCNENHPGCLDFHHTDQNKEADVSQLVSKGCKKRIEAEVAKCQVLCANCHRKKHWID